MLSDGTLNFRKQLRFAYPPAQVVLSNRILGAFLGAAFDFGPKFQLRFNLQPLFRVAPIFGIFVRIRLGAQFYFSGHPIPFGVEIARSDQFLSSIAPYLFAQCSRYFGSL